MNRDKLVDVAQAIANYGAKRIPRGARLVVAVTDVNGEWVGVGSNTHPKDVQLILRAAAAGTNRRDVVVIEAEGIEA